MGRPCSCGVELQWAKNSVTGSNIPFRSKPTQGLYTLRADPEKPGELIAEPLRLMTTEPVFLNHFVDCPDRAQHRKAR